MARQDVEVGGGKRCADFEENCCLPIQFTPTLVTNIGVPRTRQIVIDKVADPTI